LCLNRGRTSHIDAMKAGALGGAIVAAAELACIWLQLLVYAFGQPHPQTILLVAKSLHDGVFTILIGAIAGLAARWAAGPPTLDGRTIEPG
jgi:hypothetical protein